MAATTDSPPVINFVTVDLCAHGMRMKDNDNDKQKTDLIREEALGLLATNIQNASKHGIPSVVCITSCQSKTDLNFEWVQQSLSKENYNVNLKNIGNHSINPNNEVHSCHLFVEEKYKDRVGQPTSWTPKNKYIDKVTMSRCFATFFDLKIASVVCHPQIKKVSAIVSEADDTKKIVKKRAVIVDQEISKLKDDHVFPSTLANFIITTDADVIVGNFNYSSIFQVFLTQTALKKDNKHTLLVTHNSTDPDVNISVLCMSNNYIERLLGGRLTKEKILDYFCVEEKDVDKTNDDVELQTSGWMQAVENANMNEQPDQNNEDMDETE